MVVVVVPPLGSPAWRVLGLVLVAWGGGASPSAKAPPARDGASSEVVEAWSPSSSSSSSSSNATGWSRTRGSVDSSEAPRPVVLIKTARSGSSWFATLLQERVSPSFVFEDRQEEAGLARTLAQGTSLSTNPKNNLCRNLSRAAVQAQRPVISVLLERCNAVKHALSYAFSKTIKLQEERCRNATQPCERFSHNVTFDFLKNQLLCTWKREETARAAWVEMPEPRRAVTYEALLADAESVIDAVRQLVQGAQPRHQRRRSLRCGPADGDSNCTKHTGEDLRELVSNFDELAVQLHAASPCLHGLLGREAELGLKTQGDARCAAACPNPWPASETCDEATFKGVKFGVERKDDDRCARPPPLADHFRVPDAAWLCPTCEARRGLE